MSWRPIEDLEGDPRSLTDGELDALRRVWAAQKHDVLDRRALDEFDKRLRREWAIETGIIENVYTLDRGVTKTLIEKGIDAALIPPGASDRDSVAVARIIQDHYEALEGMFDFVASRRELSTSYIKELHAALLRNQETYSVVDQFGRTFEKRLEKGEYKRVSNSPTRPDGSVHEYCPPEHVASEMDRLISMHAEHETNGVPVEVESAWLHHRFTQIHPFADGNGRVARALASLVFIKAGLFPLVVERDDRSKYIECLEKADSTDLKPLVALFVEGQRTALLTAAEASWTAHPPGTAAEAITAIRDKLFHRDIRPKAIWQKANETADDLVTLASIRFKEIADSLRGEVRDIRPKFVFEPRVINHQVSIGDYHASVVLIFRTGATAELILSFHNLGEGFHGLITVAACFTPDGSGRSRIELDSFQINYEEDLETAKARFKPWLEKVIVEGLNLWRRTL